MREPSCPETAEVTHVPTMNQDAYQLCPSVAIEA